MWLDNDCCKKIGIFLGGVLFGTAGIKILSSRDAKNCYVQATAAALRAKETVPYWIRRSAYRRMPKTS